MAIYSDAVSFASGSDGTTFNTASGADLAIVGNLVATHVSDNITINARSNISFVNLGITAGKAITITFLEGGVSYVPVDVVGTVNVVNGTLTLPDAVDVLLGSGAYGWAAEPITPTLILPAASDVRYPVAFDTGTVYGTCHVPTAAQTLYGVAVDVTGTGTVTLPNTDGSTPDASLVKTTAHFGAGNATAGTLDMSLYTLISGVVAAGWVVTGHDTYTGGTPGTYPTTATSQAAQLVTDQGVVLASASEIKLGSSILGQAGTYDYVGAIAAGYASGAADQLVTDSAAVDSSKAGVTTVTTILGVTGTLDLTTYVLKTDVVGVQYVLLGHDTFTGGSAGTVTLPNTDGSTPDSSLVLSTAHYGAGNSIQGTYSASSSVIVIED